MTDIKKLLANNELILAEAAIVESLRRSENIDLHPQLVHALLIYENHGQKELSRLYNGFISIAHDAGIPIIICTSTWRANQERLSQNNITDDVNKDTVHFLKQLRDTWDQWKDNILIGGLIGCKNDCYKPAESLSSQDAYDFHSWQIDKLVQAGVDFLVAETLPAVEEATGIVQAMSKSNTPFIISFVIDRIGKILDGNSPEKAFDKIDSSCDIPPVGYMINCAYPSFLDIKAQPTSVLSRLIGFLANGSSLDHSELDGAETLKIDDISDWGDRMIELNRKYGVKILGGCCGTDTRHLKYIADNIKTF